MEDSFQGVVDNTDTVTIQNVCLPPEVDLSLCSKELVQIELFMFYHIKKSNYLVVSFKQP